MHLDPDELALLARFFAKRFPRPADRAPILDRAGLADSDAESPREAWRDILERAVAQEALAPLARAVPADDPDDANLREVRRLLVGERQGGWSVRAAVAGAAAAAVLVLAVGGVVAIGTSLSRSSVAAPVLADEMPEPAVADATHVDAGPERPADPGPDRPATTDAAPDVHAATDDATGPADDATGPTDEATGPADAVTAAPPTGETSDDDAPSGADASTDPAPAGDPASPGTADATDEGPRPLTAAHCLRKDPSVSGYWYAGEEPPGEPGDVIEIPYDVNVRAEYPHWRNDYTTDAAIRCVLYEGDRVKLSKAPIAVPVDTYWVEITGADVVPRGG